jgi:hypothetical protein
MIPQHIISCGGDILWPACLPHTGPWLYWILVLFYLWALQEPGCTDSWCYFVYRRYRDLALFNLGAIFHQAHFPAEAAIILHAAVDHAPLMAQSHFLLGNVYAILGDCNR